MFSGAKMFIIIKTMHLIEIPLEKGFLKSLQISVSGRCVFIKVPDSWFVDYHFCELYLENIAFLKQFPVFRIINLSKESVRYFRIGSKRDRIRDTNLSKESVQKDMKKIINAHFNSLGISRFKSPDKTLCRKDLHGKSFWLG